jgi:hypothetical protein
MDKRVQDRLGDVSGGHQTVAQTATELSLEVERVGYLFQGDQLGLDQQIAQSQSFFNNTLLLGLS